MGIKIETNYKKDVVKKLNVYLSNIQLSYMNVRGYHWNIVGNQFFALHSKYEEVYNELNEMADEVAERILMLNGCPIHSFSKYLKNASVKEHLNVSSTSKTINALLEDINELLSNEREILSLASDNGDEATVSMMSDYISNHEKMIWMFSAFLDKGSK